MDITSFNLPQDFADFFKLLNKFEVRYLVVGSWAVAFHGQPRYTKDIDILIARSPENAKKIFLALQEFGFGNVGISEDDLLKPNYVIQLGFEPNRIDILTNIDAIEFEKAELNKQSVVIENITLPILAVEDLILAKQASARAQDLADIEKLKKIKKDSS